MAGESLGTIKGQMILDIKQALASYTAARAAHVQTVTALQTGAGALTSVGVGMTAVGVGIGAGLMTAVNAAAEFERKLDYFGAVSAATQAEYDAVRQKALDLGRDTIYSAGQIADSFVELGKAGVGANDIINGIGEAVANLGAAADIPLDTAANIIMSAVQTFGLSADYAVVAADKLAGAANASIIEVQDLGVSFKYAGGVASALGFSFEETNTALALLGQYGIKGSTAGTSLRQVLVSLTGSTKKASNTLKELGIITEDGSNQFFDANGKAKSLAEVFQILQNATEGMSEAQQLATFKSIFATRALPTVIALTKEGAAGFAEMTAAIDKTTAMDVASQRLDNLSGDLEILRGNIETLMIDSGSKLQEFARGVVQGITQVIQWFGNLPDGVQEGILKFLAFTAVAMTVIGVLGMAGGAILNIIALFLKLGPVLTLIKSGIETVRIAVMLMNTAWLANPITWIILAIVALVAAFVLLWNNCEGFRNFWINLWARIKEITASVVDWFKGLPEWFSSVWTSIKTGAENIWNSILNFFRAIPGFLLNLFMNWTLPGLLIQHWDTIKTTAMNAWNSLLEWFKALPDNIANFFSELPGKLGYWIGFAVGSVVGFFIDMYNNVTTWVGQTVASVIVWFEQLPGRLVELAVAIYTNVTTWFAEMGVKVATFVVKLYNDVVDWFKKLPERTVEFFVGVYTAATKWMAEMAVKVAAKAVEIFNGIVDWFKKLPEKTVEFFVGVYNAIVNNFNNALNKAIEIGTNIYNGIRDAINGLPDLVSNIFNNVVDAIKGMIRKAFKAVKDFASGLWNGFKDGLGIHSPSYIEHAMWDITGVVDEETQRMKKQVRTLQGLGNGISRMGENLGFGFSDNLNGEVNNLATQVASAQKYQGELARLAASTTMATTVGVTSTETVTLDSIDKTLRYLAERPQKVINQEVTNVNPVAERDSVSTDKSLQLASAVAD